MEHSAQSRSFPKGPAGEAAAQRRVRYEAWLIANAAPNERNPELDAVLAQPNHSDVSRASLKQAVRARCWQCVHGNDDGGATPRIQNCKVTQCALWSVRPYKHEGEELPKPALKPERGDYLSIALSKPGLRGPAVSGYCFDCQGGRRQVNVMRAVDDCSLATCALWIVRPRMAAKTGESGATTDQDAAADLDQEEA